MSISDLPRRDTFVQEFYDLYTRHCWCETSRRLWKKYGMTTNELDVYYRHYPFFDRFTYKYFDEEYIEIACKARESRLRNLKKPAILEEISENTSYSEFEKLLHTNRDICDYFHNLDDTRENEFVELYTSIHGSKTDEARKEARDYWLEYARTDFEEWEYYNKPCGNVFGSENDTSASGWGEAFVSVAESLYEDNAPGLITLLTSIMISYNNCAEAYYKRALAYIKTGDRVHAAKDLRKALEIDPNHAEAGKTLDTLEPSLP
jgi:tetratricopeptide (TPR) repeat protein